MIAWRPSGPRENVVFEPGYDARPLKVRRIYACKGQSGIGVPLNRPRRQRRTHKKRVDLRIVGLDAAKELLYERLKLKEVGPGYCHFPAGYVDRQGVLQDRREYDAEYFEQLTSEKLVSGPITPQIIALH